METGTLQITVEPPDLAGDTVTFHWTQSTPNAFQRVNAFYFRYEGLDLAAYSRELLFEIFLGLQLRVFGAHPGPVELRFPMPVPRPTVDYWTAFHDAGNVRITPIADVRNYNPWHDRPRLFPDRRKAAVFFGGGKDSTLAACLLSEIEGPDQVVLIQFVGPLRPDPLLFARLEDRQQSLMLQPAGERLNVATQRVWTDFQAQFLEKGYRLRPNLELYTLGALPAMLAWGNARCTFSIPWSLYSTRTSLDGSVQVRYARSRPEELANLSRHYRRALGVPIAVTNITFPLAAHLTYQLLAERYPWAVDGIVSCTQGSARQRWCRRCAKCTGTAIWSLSCGKPLGGFDYEFFLRRSPFIRRIVEYAESGLELTVSGNAPWSPFVSTEHGFDLVCAMIARIDWEKLPPELSQAALTNLSILQGLFGNRPLDEYHQVRVRLIRMLGPDVEAEITPIIAEHFPITGTLPAPPSTGSGAIHYDFDGPFVPRTSAVAHIQRAGD